MKRLWLLASLCLATPASASTWDVRIQEMTPAGGVCVTGLLAGILQTAPCSLAINTGPGLAGGPLTSTGTITLAAFRADGRLVASTGTPASPIPTATVTNATSIFYVPSQNGGDLITIYNGTVSQAYHFGVSGMVLGLGASWGATSAFDVFATLIGGAPVLCTVPWTSLTARATALDKTVLPYSTNSASVTCRTSNTTTITVPANNGTYLGSFYTNSGPGQVDFNFGSSAPGGGAASLGLWNAYNQAPFSIQAQDSNASWSYSGSAYRSADASNGTSLVFMVGIPGSQIAARYAAAAAIGAGGAGKIGMFFNGALSPSGLVGTIVSSGSAVGGEAFSEAIVTPIAGQNVIIAVENANGSTTTFYGAGQQGLSVQISM